MLLLMQQSATDLLRRLRPDNFAAFAELFTAAVLQVGVQGIGGRGVCRPAGYVQCLGGCLLG